MTRRGRQRLVIIITIVVSLAAAAALAAYALREDVMYFRSPTEAQHSPIGQPFRLGGMVVKGSVEKLPDQITRFKVTDMQAEISAEYQGVLPDLFREGQGVVMDGALNDRGVFIASRVLAKHDENYKPPMMPQHDR